MTATLIAFPLRPCRSRTSSVRIAYVADGWCVERLASGSIIGRTRMPTRADADRIARRISLRDRATLLPPAVTGTFGRAIAPNNHSPAA